MTKTKDKTPLPLPERVITWASAGAQVTLSAESARALARDAIRLREVREKTAGAPALRGWAHVAAQAVMAIAAVQLIDWGRAVVAWLF